MHRVLANAKLQIENKALENTPRPQAVLANLDVVCERVEDL